MRIDDEAAWWVRAGHPLVFRRSLKAEGRAPRGERGGGLLEILDSAGRFVGHGYACAGATALRVLSTDRELSEASRLVERSVKRAVALRKKFLPADLTAYRIIDGEGEGLSGLNVDRFGRHAVIYQFCREAGFLVEEVCRQVADQTGVEGIYLQKRFRPVSEEPQKKEAAQLVWGARADVEQVVCENGHRFVVDVRAPVSVGLFGDLREARVLVGDLSPSADVLNCFSHTGAFSVYAAAGGARQVMSVDMSRKYNAWAKKNFELNGLDVSGHEFISADAVSLLTRWAKKKKGRFDLVILDPPTFSKGRAGGFSVKRDYPEVVESACQVLCQGGYLLACCNTFQVPEHEFHRLLAAGASQASRTLQIIRRVGLPPDFPVVAGSTDGFYLKAALCRMV